MTAMSLKRRSLFKWLFYIIIVSLSTSLSLFTDQVDNRNYFLIGCMSMGPVIVFLSGRILPKIDIPILSIIALTITIQYFVYSGSSRLSSSLFGFMFMIYFLAAVRCFMAARLSPVKLQNLLKYLIYAYCLLLLIQQFCVITGLPIPNEIAEYKNEWKLNSLSAEPSHTARYLGILMYSFLVITDIRWGHRISLLQSFRKYRYVWLSFLWVMLTITSATAIIILFLILSKYLKPRNLVFACGAVALIFMVGVTSDFKPLKRSTTFIQAVATADTDKMIEADHSASIRVVPTILCAKRINPGSIKGWIGEGAGSTSKWMSYKMAGVEKGWSGGGIVNYVLEYGLIVGLLFISFSFWCCFDNRNKLCTIGLWTMCVLFIGVNTQIGWLCILMLFIDKRISVNNANTCILR